MNVIVCGSRFWSKRGPIETWLAGLQATSSDLTIIEGGARGADRIAGQWAAKRRMSGVGWLRVPAVWKEHDPDWCRCPRNRPYRGCIGAGPRRNQQMLDWLLQAPTPRLVLAFKNDFDWTFRKGGTEDMVKRAHDAGVPFYVVSSG